MRAASLTQLEVLQHLLELVGCEFYFTEYLPYQGASKIPPTMVRQGGGSTVRMTIKDVAPLLANALETKSQKHFPSA